MRSLNASSTSTKNTWRESDNGRVEPSNPFQNVPKVSFLKKIKKFQKMTFLAIVYYTFCRGNNIANGKVTDSDSAVPCLNPGSPAH